MYPHSPGSMPAVLPTAGPAAVPGAKPAPAPGGLSVKGAGRGSSCGQNLPFCPDLLLLSPVPTWGTAAVLAMQRDSKGVLEGHCPGLAPLLPSPCPTPAFPVDWALAQGYRVQA